MKEDVAASPTFADGLVYVTNDHAKVFAIRPAAAEQGDVTATNIVWTAEEGLSDAPSPVCDGRFFLQANSSGQVTCYRCEERQAVLERNARWRSLGLAHARRRPRLRRRARTARCTSSTSAEKFGPGDGVQAGRAAAVATPAFADGRIYFRGDKTLFCVGAAGSKP